MLGVKSNRKPIKGVFAKKLREEISVCRGKSSSDKGQVQANSSKELKK